MTADHLIGIEQFEADLWKVADNLRANSNLASNEYFMPILGLIFLRHATNRYYAAMSAIEEDKGAGKMPDRPLVEADFTRRRALMLPEAARYDVLLEMPKDGNLGAAVTAAMEAVEDHFPPLAGQLPKDYQRFEDDVLEEMIRTFDSETLRTASGDVFGRIYEYFLAEFSKQGARDNGEFFTPPSIVQTIVNVIEPDHGVVLDPACGSGGMFVQSSHFIEDAGEDTMKRVTFYGHEKNETTAKLAQVNLAVHGLEGRTRAGNEAITYYKDPHELVGKCDFVMANPPFNVDEVDAEKVKGDRRLPFGLPGVNKARKVSNANYLWLQYFYSYLNENGRAGVVMSSQASSAGRDEAKVRRKLVESGAVDVMIDVRGNFFYTRTVPCQLWFFDRAKEQDEVRCDQILMLDARNIYRKVSRAIFDFSPEQQRNIAAIVWLYRGQSVRFLKLVESYLGQAVAKGETTAAPLAAFKSALGRLVDLVKPFAAEEHNPDPLTGTWEELISTQATVSTDIDALVAEVAARAADWAKGGNGATLMEPSAFAYAERHDNIEAVFKKLTERRDTADVTELLKELHRIVNEAIRTQAPGDDQAEGLTFDLSQIDVVKLRDEFAKKMHHKATALQDIREIVEQKLAQMLARNPSRMDYQQKYEEIVADYNREKDRVTIEETFRRLTELIVELDAEQRRAVEEGLSEDELALFDLLKKDDLGKAARERVKQASCDLLASIKARLKELDRFWEKEQTKADVKVFILDEVYANLPTPPFTPEEKEAVAAEVYTHVWQQAVRGEFAMAA